MQRTLLFVYIFAMQLLAYGGERPRYSHDQIALISGLADRIAATVSDISPDRIERLGYQEGREIEFWKNACVRDQRRVMSALDGYRRKPTPSSTVSLYLEVHDLQDSVAHLHDALLSISHATAKDAVMLESWLKRNLAVQKDLSEARREIYAKMYDYLQALDTEDILREASEH